MSSPSHIPTVLVTGAAKLRGREIALKLAANGWRVAVHYRDSVTEATKTVADCAYLTGGAAAFRTNLGNETAVRKLVPTVVEHLGHLDAVVHCASTFEHDTTHNFSFAAMEKHMRSNAGAVILISQALHAHIQQRNDKLAQAEQRSGVVVTLLDQNLWNQTPDFVSYTLSKAALDAANSMLARALHPIVRVVGVAQRLSQTQPMLKGEPLDNVRQHLPESATACSAADTASAVCIALQDATLTGTTLLVDDAGVAND
jgi:NAD(P)-dependent dehydrogenase (short-subunit alcohol dehydrogenase family)